jgi:hypothetical protein
MLLFRRLRFWYLRRFRGIVAAPGGTMWQEHRSAFGFGGGLRMLFLCRCGKTHSFDERHYCVRERDPETGAVTEARFVLHCPCGIGHWMNAIPRKGTP